jgi:hypothetical protein
MKIIAQPHKENEKEAEEGKKQRLLCSFRLIFNRYFTPTEFYLLFLFLFSTNMTRLRRFLGKNYSVGVVSW